MRHLAWVGRLCVLPLWGTEVEVRRIAVAREIRLRFHVNPPVATACAAGSPCPRVAPGAKGWKIAPQSGRLLVEGATELDAVHALGVALRHLEVSNGKLLFRGAARGEPMHGRETFAGGKLRATYTGAWDAGAVGSRREFRDGEMIQ